MTLRVDLYSAEGAKLNAPPIIGSAITGLNYTLALNEIGRFQLTIAATDTAAANLAIAQQVWIYRDDEGLVFRGIVEEIRNEEPEDGRAVLSVLGRSTAANLAWKTTLLNRQFDGSELADVVADLLEGTGFDAGEVDTPTTVLTTRFDGRSLWDALRFVADVFGLSMREDNLAGQIDVGEFGRTSGITLRNVPQLTPSLGTNTYLAPIRSITRRRYALDVVNRVIPLAQHTGVAGSSVWFTLASSTRTVPYTIESGTGPDGSTYYYIEDAASQATYGVREKTLNVTGIQPLGTASADAVKAANTLYDSAVTYLQRHKDEQAEYSVEVVSLPHRTVTGYRFEVGDTFRLQYEGYTQDADGRRVYLRVDTDLYLMGFTRTFDAAGADRWSLRLSTILRDIPDDGNRTAAFLRDLDAVKSAPLPYVLIGADAVRLSSDGIQMVAPTNSGIVGTEERKIQWYTDPAFTDVLGKFFMAYHSGLAAAYAQLAVKKATADSEVNIGVYDFSLGDWDSVITLRNQGGGTTPYVFSIWGQLTAGLTNYLAIQEVDDDNVQLLVRKGGQLQEVGVARYVVQTDNWAQDLGTDYLADFTGGVPGGWGAPGATAVASGGTGDLNSFSDFDPPYIRINAAGENCISPARFGGADNFRIAGILLGQTVTKLIAEFTFRMPDPTGNYQVGDGVGFFADTTAPAAGSVSVAIRKGGGNWWFYTGSDAAFDSGVAADTGLHRGRIEIGASTTEWFIDDVSQGTITTPGDLFPAGFGINQTALGGVDLASNVRVWYE